MAVSLPGFVILITREGMGEAETELQYKLIGKYLSLLLENNSIPSAICFYAEGVKLAVNGSTVIDQLKNLEANGCRLILCSTCLEYFQLSHLVQVGIIGSMADILDAQILASKVVTI